jgi:hemerythrin-like domain-containing protein
MTMQLLEDLQIEHERIERVLGALRTFADRLLRGEAPLADLERFATFFRVYAGAFHHEREEEILFPALGSSAALPLDRGPVAVLLDDHHQMARTLERLWAATDPAEIEKLAIRYSHALWQHIDVENMIFFPECESQLRRNGVPELEGRRATQEEVAAALVGDSLAAAYPPMEPDAIRGDGCVMCHAYGETCRGLEREWWNEWAWEELDGHVAAS